ncbi:MAG: GatB/YqeY domain-containing protein [Patescibacteria group bacterium]|nr:GatB/YqeY domain-containing protein [Patescibacteria group bacterium]
MLSLIQIESDLKDALKAKDAVKANVLRGLKTRIQNEKIAKTRDLEEAELLALVKSEVKRRKEAMAAFRQGGRQELADKESREAEILSAFLPPQLSEQAIAEAVDKVIAETGASAADFGKLMGKLKAQLGSQADGAVLAKILKEKLKD